MSLSYPNIRDDTDTHFTARTHMHLQSLNTRFVFNNDIILCTYYVIDGWKLQLYGVSSFRVH